jgi:DNA-binding XRE family transcriptional regulator
MKKQTARLAAVTVVEGNKLQVTYTDRRTIYLDMDDVIGRYAVFAPLSDPVELATVAVADWGWSLEWQCGATLDADRVFELSLEQAGMMENVEFRRWQDKNQLSLSEAAEAIGLTRRTVSQYRTGARPVSRTVTLACKGWEAERLAA